jgi:hypothetical protein
MVVKQQQKAFSRSLITVALALSLSAPVAYSADNGFYFGASVGDQSTDYDWRPLDSLAVEVDYVDFGSSVAPLFVACPAVVGIVCPEPELAVDTSAVSVSAVGMFAVGPVDLFGRAGFARWKSDSIGPLGFTGSSSGTDLTLGIGAQFRIQSFALRLELERFDLSRGSTDVASLGFTYTLL